MPPAPARARLPAGFPSRPRLGKGRGGGISDGVRRAGLPVDPLGGLSGRRLDRCRPQRPAGRRIPGVLSVAVGCAYGDGDRCRLRAGDRDRRGGRTRPPGCCLGSHPALRRRAPDRSDRLCERNRRAVDARLLAGRPSRLDSDRPDPGCGRCASPRRRRSSISPCSARAGPGFRPSPCPPSSRLRSPANGCAGCWALRWRAPGRSSCCRFFSRSSSIGNGPTSRPSSTARSWPRSQGSSEWLWPRSRGWSSSGGWRCRRCSTVGSPSPCPCSSPSA